eukprot:scaffold197998_cov34-Tisochrysis_lutea.AAC.3
MRGQISFASHSTPSTFGGCRKPPIVTKSLRMSKPACGDCPDVAALLPLISEPAPSDASSQKKDAEHNLEGFTPYSLVSMWSSLGEQTRVRSLRWMAPSSRRSASLEADGRCARTSWALAPASTSACLPRRRACKSCIGRRPQFQASSSAPRTPAPPPCLGRTRRQRRPPPPKPLCTCWAWRPPRSEHRSPSAGRRGVDPLSARRRRSSRARARAGRGRGTRPCDERAPRRPWRKRGRERRSELSVRTGEKGEVGGEERREERGKKARVGGD